MGLRMDGPNVNKAFKRKLVNKLESEKGNSFLSLVSCVLHTVNNGFGKGMKEIKEYMDIEQFLFDVFFFFKYSAARREDYKGMESLTDVTAEYLLKYCSTRWLYIGKVIVRLLEQIENLKQYFLTFLPGQTNFKGKKGVDSTERYQRIKVLNNKMLLPTLSFIVYGTQIFKSFIMLFQSDQPLIHFLHERMKKLVAELLVKFYDKSIISGMCASDGSSKLTDLNELDVHSKHKHNSVREVGSKTRELLKNVDVLEKKRFEEGPVTSFYLTCVEYLLKNLPLNNQVLIDVKYLHPNMRLRNGLANGISRLTANVWKCLGESAHDIFGVKKSTTTVDELTDIIKLELSTFQVDNNLPDMYKKDDNGKKKGQYQQPSYWKYAWGGWNCRTPTWRWRI